MRQSTSKKSNWSYFIVMGWIGLFAVFIGFSKTFIIPVKSGSFKAPFTIYLHGALAFAWISLFVIQALLIRFKNYRIHKLIGKLGFAIALGTAVTMLPAGVFQVTNELKNGFGEGAYSNIVGVCTTAILFLILVTIGIVYRHNSEAHKRWLLLATILLLWPAWFRFRHYFPSVPRPDIWFAVILSDSFIVIAWIWDKWANGKVHAVLLFGGLFIIVEHTFELLVYDSAAWRSLGKQIYNLLL